MKAVSFAATAWDDRGVLNRLLVSVIIAPIALCIAGVTIVNLSFDGVGLAPVPLLLTAYVLGFVVWGGLSLAFRRTFWFRTVIIAFGICALCVMTDTNERIALWAIGAPAVGGLAATVPLARLPWESRTDD